MRPGSLNERLADRYRLDRKIGEGGMGAVHVAFDEKTKRRVAVKILLIEGDDKMYARFEQEARATMELAHPNIVRVTDFQALPGQQPFLVMDLLDGESLRDRMKREGRLPIEDAARIAFEICQALAAAHAAGVVHRDVKPPNIFLVKPDGQAKLLDFGIAKVRADFGKVHTTTGTVLGTPSYFAPEQLLARDVDGRADVHAVGVMLYEMLAGRRPFTSENPVELTTAILEAAPPPLEELRPDVPREIASAVHDALAKERSARPTAAQLAERLAPFVSNRHARASGGPFVVAVLAVGAAAALGYVYTCASETAPAAPPASALVDASGPPDVASASSFESPTSSAAAPAPVLVPVEQVPPACAGSDDARDAGLQALFGDVRGLLYDCVVDGGGTDNDARMLVEACKKLGDRGCVDRVRELHATGSDVAGPDE